MPTTVESFLGFAAEQGGRECWRYGERRITWREAGTLVRRAARALRSLGVRPGEAVTIVGPNRPEWAIADLGALAAGAVPAPLYPTLTPEQALYIADHSEARVAIVADAAQMSKLRGSFIRQFVLMQGSASGALTWEEFLARGDQGPPGEVDAWVRALRPTDLATLIYTSGTTGPAKGAMLSHDNLLFAAERARLLIGASRDDLLVSYLPLSHIAEQMLTLHGPALSGGSIWFCDQLDKVGEVLKQAQPTIFFGVPRVWEKMQARIEEQVAQAPAVRRALFRWGQRSRSGLADKLVKAKVRAALGLSRARFVGTGAALMPRPTLDFFESLGLRIMDIYAQTESTACCTSNLAGARRPGSVGRALPDTELRLASDGEILTRGRHVFLGYFKEEAATRDAIDAEGFLHTGDVGQLDADGFLHITDRKKELLVTSGGKNVSPQNIEGELNRIPGVAQAVVVGDARKHLGALFTLDPARWDGRRYDDPSIVAELSRHVAEVNARLASFETIKKFRVLPGQFSIETGELTPTMKLKRKVVAQKYAKEIDELFA